MPLDFSSLAVYRETYSPDFGFAIVQEHGCTEAGVSVISDNSIPTAHVYPCSVPASSVQAQLAPLQPVAALRDGNTLSHNGGECPHVKPSPSHFMMCGYSLLLGAMEATINAGAEDKPWVDSFKDNSREAAASVAPLSRYLLDKHIFAEER